MKMMSLFTHPQVILNLYEFLSSAEQDDIWKNMCNQTVDRLQSWY